MYSIGVFSIYSTNYNNISQTFNATRTFHLQRSPINIQNIEFSGHSVGKETRSEAM